MREKELRLALVCYGGVSLAVYMHGIVKEAWKLLRASRAFHDEAPDARASLHDSEIVYADLLEAMTAHVNVRVLIDIVAGASAGGMNGVFLAHAIAGGHDMEPLRELWLENADIERLLDPDAAPHSRFSKLYARPIVWLAGRDRAADVDSIEDAQVRDEVRVKLSRFIRSRWFEPPFSGPGFTRLIYDALCAMEAGERTPPLLPSGQPLDLKVTATDFYGSPERLAVNSPPEIVETEHRLVIAFRDDGNRSRREIASRASLAFAARATASFPGAFPPFQAQELDGVLDEVGDGWSDRDAFLAHIFPRRASAGIDLATASLIDGSVLNNAPFRPAIEALGNRPAHREVDRRFVYIDPKPGGHVIGMPGVDPSAPPGFFTTILRALSDIPREQPIRDSVEAINDMSRRVRRLRHIVAGMRDEVDSVIERAIGRRLLFFRLTPKRLNDWRSLAQTAAARDAGYAYAAYGHLKLSHVIEGLVDTLVALGGHDEPGTTEAVRRAVWAWARENGFDRLSQAGGRERVPPHIVAFLRRFDLPFRIRRLRFLIRRLTELAADPPKGQSRRALDQVKAALYELLAPFLDRRTPAFFGDRLGALAARAASEPAPALERLAELMSLTTLDAAADGGIVDLLSEQEIGAGARRALTLAYLGFPFYDIATLPLLQGQGLDEFDEVKVDRISPDDATTLAPSGAVLKGVQFNAFGAFFSRAWRENDYLWGRLHAADRLIDIVASTLPEGATLKPGAIATLKTRAFRAIIEAERAHLANVPELFAEIEARLGG